MRCYIIQQQYTVVASWRRSYLCISCSRIEYEAHTFNSPYEVLREGGGESEGGRERGIEGGVGMRRIEIGSEEKRKLGGCAMKRAPCLSEPAKRPDDRDDYTAWTAVYSPSGSTGYSFFSGVGRALWANSGLSSAQ